MKKPLKQKAYEYILENITSGKFPPGMRLGEVSLAKNIGISPTPLREAFRQLTAEGILEHRPNSGIIVAELDSQKLHELYEVREALETYCAGQAAIKMNRIESDNLRACLDRQFGIARELRKSGQDALSSEQEIEYMKADAEFHRLIFKAAGNTLINKIMRECHLLERLLGFHSHKHTLNQIATTLKHHYQVWKRIRAQDSAGAEHWMKIHIYFSRTTRERP